MAVADPTAADIRRWLTLDSGQRRLPHELRAGTRPSRAALAAWIEKHQAGDAAAEASRRLGPESSEAQLLRNQARDAQERMLFALGLTNEEVRSRMARSREAALDAIVLMRY